MTDDAVRVAITVQTPRNRAFELFTDLESWWPHEYTWSGEALEEIGIEGWVDGMCFEVGPHGFRCDWGRVLVWEPGGRLAFSWQIGPRREPVPDPGKAGEVDVRFIAQGPRETRIELEHRGFARHGEGWQGYCDQMGSPEGWPQILDRLAAIVG